MSFDDVRQLILIRIWENYDSFNPNKGKFLHWVNRVISNSFINILRDNYMSFQRPCLAGCIHNVGEDNCDRTPSGKQCEECPIYKDWKKRRGARFNVKQTLPLENHAQESESRVCTNVDVAEWKVLIDKKIRPKLTRHEWALYKQIYIDGKDENEVGAASGYKSSGRLGAGYQIILKLRKKVLALSRQIINDEMIS